jgi:hypothetical protein
LIRKSDDSHRQKPRRVLYIGLDLPREHQGEAVQSLDFAELTKSNLADFAPDLVICQLISATHDAPMILEQLNACGYQGECYVLSPHLPRPHLVEAELRESAGNIMVKLITSV